MSARLRKLRRRDFSVLLSSRNKHSTSKHFSLIFSDIVHGYAVVVSKKIAKTAVKRHKLKRQILSILHKSTLTQSVVVVFACKGAEKLSFKEINRELQEIFATMQIK